MKKGSEEKTRFSTFLPNHKIITACRIELRAQEVTMNEKLTMIGLFRSLQGGESYKYLGILEADKFSEENMKLNVLKEYIRRLRKVLKSMVGI